MTDAELLTEVKKRIGITGDYQDDTLTGHIQDVKDFMQDAGVSEEVMQTTKIIGAGHPWCVRFVGLWER